jgi:predicted GIY-YIG superfamily endonuclease
VIDLPTSDGVYVIHFRERIGGDGRNGAQHYIGWASDIAARIEQHHRGQGAAIMAHVARSAIGFDVVAIFPGAARDDERRMKKAGHHAERRCPVCRAERILQKSVPEGLSSGSP